MDRWLRNLLVIVQHQHQGFALLDQAINQSREHRLPGWMRHLVQGSKGEKREPGPALFQCGQDIGPKLKGSVVARVKRHPGHWWVAWSKRANPVCEQRGLPKARGGGDENDASAKSGIEQGQETRASNELMGRCRQQKLGRKQRIRRRAWDRLWLWCVAVGFMVLMVHDRSSFMVLSFAFLRRAYQFFGTCCATARGGDPCASLLWHRSSDWLHLCSEASADLLCQQRASTFLPGLGFLFSPTMVLSTRDFPSALLVYSDGQSVIPQKKRWRCMMDDTICSTTAEKILHQGWGMGKGRGQHDVHDQTKSVE